MLPYSLCPKNIVHSNYFKTLYFILNNYVIKYSHTIQSICLNFR